MMQSKDSLFLIYKLVIRNYNLFEKLWSITADVIENINIKL